MTWNLNLCLSSNKTILIPFHHLITPQSPPSPSPPQHFPFLYLPTDIQLLIYDACDPATLLHLMHTSPHTRIPCQKRFWANNTSNNFWYHCPSSALFTFSTHSQPIIQHDMDFAAQITRIEINFSRLEVHFADDEEMSRPRQKHVSTEAKAREFWGRVRRAFPRVRRVVLLGLLPGGGLPPEYEQAYAVIARVIELAPRDTGAQVAFDSRMYNQPARYTLWSVHPNNTLEPTWQISDPAWNPARILLPARRFSASPLGDLVTFTQRNAMLMLELRGLDWLKQESYARYAGEGGIHCPRLDCPFTFPDRNLWIAHLKESEHGLGYGYRDEELCAWKGTPGKELEALEARQQRIDEGFRASKTLLMRVGCAWGEEGSEQRRVFEEDFLARLREENFAVPGEVLPECEWIDTLHMYLDPGHIYYSGE